MGWQDAIMLSTTNLPAGPDPPLHPLRHTQRVRQPAKLMMPEAFDSSLPANSSAHSPYLTDPWSAGP